MSLAQTIPTRFHPLQTVSSDAAVPPTPFTSVLGANSAPVPCSMSTVPPSETIRSRMQSARSFRRYERVGIRAIRPAEPATSADFVKKNHPKPIGNVALPKHQFPTMGMGPGRVQGVLPESRFFTHYAEPKE